MGADPSAIEVDQFDDWLKMLGTTHPHGTMDRLGSLNYIDADARRRASEAVRDGLAVPLGRPLEHNSDESPDHEPAFSIVERQFELGPLVVGSDRVEIDCHGFAFTHVDAFNHCSYFGEWYGGRHVADPSVKTDLDVSALAQFGIFARAIHVDIPRYRNSEYVSLDEPVMGYEIAEVIAASGIALERGDALLIDSGRDRFEAHGGEYRSGVARAGLGADAAQWLSNQEVGLLLWDMQDLSAEGAPFAPVHGLLWAIGLVLVDNCSFTRLRESLSGRDQIVGAIAVAPLDISRGTGCCANPLFIT